MKKLIPALLAIVTIGVGTDYVSPALGQVDALGIPVPRLLYWVPVALGVVVYIVSSWSLASVGPNCGRTGVVRCAVGILLLVGVSFAALNVPIAFKEHKVGCVSLRREELRNLDWQKFQSLFSFKVISVEDSTGARICFQRIEDRAEKIEAALKSASAKKI
jgi:hypothetical protein